ncbi:MAG: sulfotransferase family protein [Rhodobacteraceae bacterium]|nr:sulfotransferase family protein [Paracoccaceae bacterium]
MTAPLPTGTEGRDRALLWLANRLVPFYRRFPHSGTVSITSLDPRGVALPDRRVFYSRIPKAANSTVMAALQRLAAGQADPLRAKSRFPRPSRLSAATVAELDRDWFCFTVVRDPHARALSAFLDKVGRRTGHSAHFFRWFRPATPREPGFADFVAYLEEGGLWHDLHWAPQHGLLHLPFARYDMIGRVERLETDLPAILARAFGAPPAGIERFDHAPPTGAAARLPAMLTPALRAALARLYAADFAAFGYDPGA